MAKFEIGSVKADTVQMGDKITNCGLSEARSQELLRLISEARNAATRLPDEPRSGEIREILAEAAEPSPEQTPDRLTTLMNRVKVLAAGITGAVQIAESADRIIAISTGNG